MDLSSQTPLQNTQKPSPTSASQSQDGFEFLDLTDVGDVERYRLSSALLQQQQQQQQHHQQPHQHDLPPQPLPEPTHHPYDLPPHFRLPRPTIFFSPKVLLVPLLGKDQPVARFAGYHSSNSSSSCVHPIDDDGFGAPSHPLTPSGHESPADHSGDVQLYVNQPFSPPDLPHVSTDCRQTPPPPLHSLTRVPDFVNTHFLYNSAPAMSPHTGSTLHPQQPAGQQQQQQQSQQNAVVAQQSGSGGPSPHNNAQQQQPALLSSQPPHSQQQQHAGPQMYGPVPTQGFVQHGGGVYPVMSPAVPGNVFVSNVSPNVNMHGYISHSTPLHYMSANAAPFIPAEQQQQQQQQQQIALATTVHEQTQQIQIQPSANTSHMRGGIRRGRGRSSNGIHRREFSTRPPIVSQDPIQQTSDQPQQQQQQSSQPQQQPQQHHLHQLQQQVATTQLQQNQQQQQPPPQPPNQQQQPHHQAMMHPNYPPYPGYPGYGYYQPGPVPVGYQTAQHATGTPLYANPVPVYLPTPPQYYQYHPNMMYQHVVPADFPGMIDGNKDDNGGPEPNGPVQQFAWHPTQIAWHPSMQPAQQHSDEYLPDDEIDQYNNYQPHPMDSHMLSPIYTKDDHGGFHSMHAPHQEFIPVSGMNPHMTHLSPQPMGEPNQHHHLSHHAQLQQQQQQQQPQHMQIHPHQHAQMQLHHQQQAHHAIGQPMLMAVPPMMMHPNEGVEFVMEDNMDNDDVNNVSPLINQIAQSNPQHLLIDTHVNINNNNVNTNEYEKMESITIADHEVLTHQQQQPPQSSPVITADMHAIPSEPMYVSNVPLSSVHASTSPSHPMPAIDNSPHGINNNNNNNHPIATVPAKIPVPHHNPFSQPSQSTNNLSNSSSATSTISSSSVMSTEDLDKLVKSTSEKLIIKNDRPSTYNTTKTNHNNNGHNVNQKPAPASGWNYNKKNTVNVSVSAVPMHTPPNVLLPTPTKLPLIAHTPALRSDYVNHVHVSAVPTKPYVPKPQQQLQPAQQTAQQSPQAQPSLQPLAPLPTPPNQPTQPIDDNASPVRVVENITSVAGDTPSFPPKPIVSTSSIASTAVPQQLQQELRSKQVEVVPHLHFKEAPVVLANSPEPTVTVTTVTVTAKDEVIVPLPTPVSAAPTAAAGSWASLFNNKSVTTEPLASKKPSTKVQPFDSNTTSTVATTANVTQQQQPLLNRPSSASSGATTASTSSATTASTTSAPAQEEVAAPKAMSYSAASSQGLSVLASPINRKANVTKAVPAPSKIVLSADDTSSLKLGEFFQKYKVDNNAISLRPRGLVNRSNYCYMNASLQALVACPPFYNLLKSIPQHHIHALRSKASTPTIDAMIDLVNEFAPLPPGARLTTRRGDRGNHSKKNDDVPYDLVCDPSFEPTTIHKLWNSSRSEHEGRQEDAEEFLSYLLNKLNDEMLELKKLVEKPHANGEAGNNETGDDGDEWKLIDNKNKGTVTRTTDFGSSPLSDIFRGIWRSRLQREGDTSADTMQPFFTLQLNIDKATTVKEALDNFFGKDQLDGFTCSKTNQAVMAWQQMTLEKLPIVMVLHLKWFHYKLDGCTKILKTVEFPIELKIDTKIVSSKKYSKNQKQYKLFAVVYHDGKDASKGHYIIDAYHCGYSYWLRYDDSTVKPVAESAVLHPRAPRVPYLLYYRRCDTVIAPATTNDPAPTKSAGANNNNK